MKKSIFTSLLAVIILIVLLLSTAAPAMGASLTLLSVTARGSRGLILTFSTGSDYSGAMNGTATVGWHQYPMYCAQATIGQLVCFIGSGIFRHAGKTALIVLGNNQISVSIPDRPLPNRLPGWWCEEFPNDPRCK